MEKDTFHMENCFFSTTDKVIKLFSTRNKNEKEIKIQFTSTGNVQLFASLHFHDFSDNGKF